MIHLSALLENTEAISVDLGSCIQCLSPSSDGSVLKKRVEILNDLDTRIVLNFTPILNTVVGFTGAVSFEKAGSHADIEIGNIAEYEVVVKLSFDTADNGSISKTSYFDVKLPVTIELLSLASTDRSYSRTLLLLASCCFPVLYVDKTDAGDDMNRSLHFTPCFVGNTYFKDLQLWNRSECFLEYLVDSDQPAGQFTISEFDNGAKIELGHPLKLPPFASKRLRVSFKSNVVGDGSVQFYIRNLNNFENLFGILCTYSVVDKEESDLVSIIKADDSVLQYGKLFSIDTVYSDIVSVSGFWVQNNSKEDIQLSISSHGSPDIMVNFSKLFLNKQHSNEFIVLNDRNGECEFSYEPVDETTSSADGSQSDLENDISIDLDPISTHRKHRSPRSDFNTWGARGHSYQEILPYSFLRLEARDPSDLPFENSRYFLGRSKSSELMLGTQHDLNVITVGAGKKIPCTVQIKTTAISGSLQKNYYNLDIELFLPLRGKKYVRVLKCKASVCQAIISVQSPIHSLGECCVGEYRQFFVNVTNDCDLPVLVSPFVESDTIGIITKEIEIPPHETIPLKFEFVPKIVNLDYHRIVFFKNLYNSANNTEVEVRAKNVDTHQVLLHSQFYKVNVRNTMRQMQIFYDFCLYGMQNLRLFSIKNSGSSEIITLSLKLQEPDSGVQIFSVLKGLLTTSTSIGDLIARQTSSKSKVIDDLRWGEISADSAHQREEVFKRSNSITEDDMPKSYSDMKPKRPDVRESLTQLDSREVLSLMEQSEFPFSVVEKKQELSQSELIAYIQKSYRQLGEIISNGELLAPLVDHSISIDPGKTIFIAVIFKPTPSLDKKEELNTHYLTRNLMMELSPIAGVVTPEEPLILPIRAKACRSEMSLLQKNINFGKTIVGSISKKELTLVNQSNIPLLYSFEKTGSIFSGYLTISGGRKGVIPASSSMSIELSFKPSLAGLFEEVVTIRNVLCRENDQVLVVKARVTKPDSFQLTMLPSRDPIDVPDYFESVMTENANSMFIGDLDVYRPSTRLVEFKIKNMTMKSRQFIVDASHANTKVLLPDDPSETPFMPTPEIVQTVVIARCEFTSKLVVCNISADEKKILEDNLEKFQQKLKIAVRKNKAEKIEKYRSKLAKTLDQLNASSEDQSFSADSDTLVYARSLYAFHISIPADCEAKISISVTLFPSSSFAVFDSFLPFVGNFRVFECRNEDIVKSVYFCGVLSCNDYFILQPPEQNLIPVISPERTKKSMTIPRMVNFGDIRLGQSRIESCTIVNSSTMKLHYASTTQMSSSYKIEILSGGSGIIEPGDSKILCLNFSASEIGLVDTAVYVINLNDGSDGEVISISANVIKPESSFVKLHLARVEGLYQLPIGLLHIHDPSVSSGTTKKFCKTFAIENVSDQDILVTAVSNLKKQCLVYADSAETTPVVSIVIKRGELLELFVTILPTITPEMANYFKAREDKIENESNQQLSKMKQRIIIGGIRLLFYSVPDDEFSQPRKLLEKSIQFQGNVGFSRLIAKLEDPVLRITEFQSNDKVLSFPGQIILKNFSRTFPLHYRYEGDTCMCFDVHDISDITDYRISICDDPENNLDVSEEKFVPFTVFLKNVSRSGLLVVQIPIRNVDTHRVTVLKLTIFFDSLQLKIENLSSTFSRKVIRHSVLDIESIQADISNSVVFVHPNVDAQNSFVVSGMSSQFLTKWKLENTATRTINITVVSDLPLSFSLLRLDANNNYVMQPRQRSSATSLLTLPTDVSVNNLLPISESFSLQKGESVILELLVTAGKETDGYADGYMRVKQGLVAFVVSEASLNSFFSRQEDHLLHVVFLKRLMYSYIYSKVILKKTHENLGKLRVGSSVTFSVTLENLSEVEAPIKIRSLPQWIDLIGGVDVDEITDTSVRALLIPLPFKTATTLMFQVTVPDVETKLLEYTMSISNLANKQDLLDFTVALEVDIQKAVLILDERRIAESVILPDMLVPAPKTAKTNFLKVCVKNTLDVAIRVKLNFEESILFEGLTRVVIEVEGKVFNVDEDLLNLGANEEIEVKLVVLWYSKISALPQNFPLTNQKCNIGFLRCTPCDTKSEPTALELTAMVRPLPLFSTTNGVSTVVFYCDIAEEVSQRPVLDVKFQKLVESFEIESTFESTPQVLLHDQMFRTSSVRYVFNSQKFDSIRVDWVLHSKEVVISISPCDITMAHSVTPYRGADGNWCPATLSLQIFDEAHVLHPPLVINIVVCILNSDSSSIPAMPSLPVSKTNRKKDYLGRQQTRETSLSVAPSTNHLRLRGLTPSSAFTDQYEISLGQQIQKLESIEWMLTIENTLPASELSFRISSVPVECSWLSVGQTHGSIAPRNATSVMLYFSKATVGIYFAYITVENLSTPGEMHILRCTLEVVQDSNVFLLKPLYRVITALSKEDCKVLYSGSSSQPISMENVQEEDHSDKLVIDFCEVYPGISYTSRSFVVNNISDIPLEFTLSSTFAPSVLQLPLAISVKPKEQVIVYLKFLPNIDVSILDEFEEPIISGEVFISCRLVKDHHDRIKIHAVLKTPKLEVLHFDTSMDRILAFEDVNVAFCGCLDGLVINDIPLCPTADPCKGFQFHYIKMTKNSVLELSRSSDCKGSVLLYNRDHPTEKYRIFGNPILVDQSPSSGSINTDNLLEASVENFIRKFTTFWSQVSHVDLYTGCITEIDKIDMILESLIHDQYCEVDGYYSYISYFADICTEYSLPWTAKIISDLNFELFVLTDELIARSVTAVKLSQLLFTMLCGHYVFSSLPNRSLPKLLIPFAKQVIYYLSFFPLLDDAEIMRDLLRISRDVKSRLLLKNTQS